MIIISYSFYHHIQVIDLNDSLNNIITLEVGRDTTGGYRCVISLITQSNSLYEKVVAGSSNGMIRMWNVPINKSNNAKLTFHNISSNIRPNWEVSSDPTTSTKNAAPVVSLVQLPNLSNSLLSMNSLGIIIIWNLEILQTLAFSSFKTPTPIRRINIWEDPLFSSINARNELNILTINCKFQLNNELLIITLNNNQIYYYNLFTGNFVNNNNNSNNENIIQLNNYKGITDETITSEMFEMKRKCRSANKSNITFISHLNNIGIISEYETYNLLLVNLNPINQNTFIRSNNPNLNTFKNSNNSKNSLNIYNKYETNNTIKTRRGYDSCLTLPGHIISAEINQNEILLSNDLTQYLVSNSIISNWPSKSCDIVLYWFLENENEVTQRFTYQQMTQVEVINNYQIILQDSYTGPTVTNGWPKIYIKTNLKHIFNNENNILINEQNTNTNTNTNKIVDNGLIIGSKLGFPEIINKMELTSPATVISSHPNLPFIIIGTLDDNILFMTV